MLKSVSHSISLVCTGKALSVNSTPWFLVLPTFDMVLGNPVSVGMVVDMIRSLVFDQ